MLETGKHQRDRPIHRKPWQSIRDVAIILLK